MSIETLKSHLENLVQSHQGHPAQAQIRDLSKMIINDSRFSELHPDAIPDSLIKAVNEQINMFGLEEFEPQAAANRAYHLASEVHKEHVNPYFQPKGETARAPQPKISPKKDPVPTKPGKLRQPDPHNAESWLQRPEVTKQQKFWGGVALISAALNGFFALDTLKNIKKTNPQTGQQETQWSQVGIATLNASLAAGLAWVGVQQLRGRF